MQGPHKPSSKASSRSPPLPLPPLPTWDQALTGWAVLSRCAQRMLCVQTAAAQHHLLCIAKAALPPDAYVLTACRAWATA